MKVLVTGGCGMLGSNLAKRAIDLGLDVCVIDALFKLDGIKNLTWLNQSGKISFFNIDIKDLTNLEFVFDKFKPDVVFHVAGQVSMISSIDDPLRDFQTNAIGGFNVLYCIRKYCPNATVIYSSTNKVYGDMDHIRYKELDTRFVAIDYPDGFDQSLAISYSTPYGCSKGVADSYFLDWAKIYDIKSVVLRHSTIYGSRQYANFGQGWVGWFCSQAIRQSGGLFEKFSISGSGKQVRDILCVKDAVDLYFLITHNIDKVCGMAFNVGGGIQNSFSITELISYLQNLVGRELQYYKIDERKFDQKFFVCNYNTLTDIIGWHPKIDKHYGVEDMINWLKNENEH